MKTLSIKGRIHYEDTCSSCGADRGFVRKSDIGKKCRPCAGRLNRLGAPSSMKGVKTGQPAWNRGQYFNNKNKKKVRNRMSRRMRYALSGCNLSKKWRHIFDLVGYSIDDLEKHLESQFKPCMSWHNIGEWHIDHVIPESSFNYSSVYDMEFKHCWSLSNLQPLWATDNLKKGSKLRGVGYSNCSQ